MNSLRHLLALLALVAGCSGADPVLTCQPACAAGYHCEATGCVRDDGSTDLGVAARDFTTSRCAMACAGATPHCDSFGICQACLEDEHCPQGQSCKTVGQVRVCTADCSKGGPCPQGSACCNGACLDTSKDPQNCGACGIVCAGANSRATCEGGQCVRGTCNAGWGDCNANPADGCETSLRADPANCTACGMVCDIKNAIAGCSGAENPPCYLAACRFGFDDCNSDPKDGCETDVRSSNVNCGGCGMSCPGVPHARNTCVNATCQLTGCDAGYADCDGVPQNGCESASAGDAANCGACGNRCGPGLICAQGLCTCPQCNLPNARSTCVNLKCAVAQCNVNWGDCDGLPQNGCEQNLVGDARNCGQCGVACAQGLVCVNGSCTCPNCMRPNGKTACINNVCMLDSCFQGFGNCDGDEVNGCEKDLGSDAANCGACGAACGGGKSCLNGMCVEIVHGCNGDGLARGCVSVAEACWCKTSNQWPTGREVCNYQKGYMGTYYSINGRDSLNPKGPMDGAKARVILAALKEVPSQNHCAANAQQGSCSFNCACDCATNILAGDNGASWGTDMSCWTDQQRWDRATNIVRCVGYEQ